MARVLFTVWPFAGCVHPQIAVARSLARLGHSVAFYTASKYQSLLEGQQFEFFPFQPKLERAVEEYVLSPTAMGLNWSRPWRLRPQIRGLFLETVPLQIEDIQQIMSRWGVDGIVTDPAIWGPFLVLSELHKIPVAILSYACGCMLPGPKMPPMGLGLPIAQDLFGTFRNRLVGLGLNWFLGDTRRRASALRQEFGLSAIRGPVIGLARRLPLYLVPSCP